MADASSLSPLIYKTPQGYCFNIENQICGPYNVYETALDALYLYKNPFIKPSLNKVETNFTPETKSKYQFDIGDTVEKIDGDHGYTATIAARFFTKAGAERYVVEIPAIRGSFLHIVGPKNLRKIL